MTTDYKGYYKTLGVDKSATAADIKAAYRARAMELHPDRNIGRDTTAEFQDLQEAYNALSNDKAREQYDADCAVSSASTDSRQGAETQFSPVHCDACGCISGQPRFKVYYYVFGVIYYSHKRPVQGIYCASCDLKAAVKATLFTSILGWWGVWSFFWTLHALFTHLFGREFATQNAFLQSQQTFYFIQKNQLELAYGSAKAAIDLINKALKRWEKPTADQQNHLKEMRDIFTRFIEESDIRSADFKFKSVDGFRTPTFIAQIIIIIALLGGVSIFFHSLKVDSDNKEIERLEKIGFTHADAQNVVLNGESALSKLDRGLPPSGIYTSASPISEAYSGPLKINNNPSSSVLLKLIKVGEDRETLSVFVRAGETVEVSVPFGKYIVKSASGNHWYGDAVRFGPDTHYAQFKDIFEFRVENNQAIGTEITMTKSRSGNLKENTLDAQGF